MPRHLPKHTLHDYAKAALEDLGYTEDHNAQTGRYTVMKHQNEADKIFLRRSGAIRKGRNVTTSVPLLETRKNQIVHRGVDLLDGASRTR